MTKAAHGNSVNNGPNENDALDAADNRTRVRVTGSPFSSSMRVIVLLPGGIS